MKFVDVASLAALFLVATAPFAPRSEAAPLLSHAAAMEAPSKAIVVRYGGWHGGWGYRNWGGYRGWGHRGWGHHGWGWGAAATGAIVGGAIAGSAYYGGDPYYSGDPYYGESYTQDDCPPYGHGSYYPGHYMAHRYYGW